MGEQSQNPWEWSEPEWREIVGRYRLHGVSSLTMTTLDT